MIEVFIAAVPLLLLIGSLLVGYYPGCETIVRIAERIAGMPVPRRRLKSGEVRRQRRPRSHAPHGGLLIALGHAQRPPPLAV
jgi:hypothetical protein